MGVSAEGYGVDSVAGVDITAAAATGVDMAVAATGVSFSASKPFCAIYAEL